MKNSKGITLIALIITVIVMLILAGVAINLSIGDNGIFKKTQEASEISKKASLKEELELKITDLEMEKLREGRILTKEVLVEKLPDMGVVIIDHTDKVIEGEYEDYQITIDENNKVTIGGALTGAKPTAEFSITPTTQGVEKVELQIVASITEGEIASIESLNDLTPKTENSKADKIYEITQNGEYKFKITGDNGRIAIVKKTINNLINESESLLKAISEVTQSGEMKVKVAGKTSSGAVEPESYSLNIIRHEGDMVLDGTTAFEGSTLANNVYEFGSTNDVATASENAKNTVVLKIEGNLAINSGVTLTAVKSAGGFGGPKGLIVYCTGTLTNNGTMSMTARGAKAEGDNVYLWKNNNDTWEYVPKEGGAGGEKVTTYGYDHGGDSWCNKSGLKGTDGTLRGTGGGGSGSTRIRGGYNLSGFYGTGYSGNGACGTSYSGGSGGGGCSPVNHTTKTYAGDGVNNRWSWRKRMCYQ